MRACVCVLFTVTQLQTTLASVQELLIQQQKKIQELSQELANSHVSLFYSTEHVYISLVDKPGLLGQGHCTTLLLSGINNP